MTEVYLRESLAEEGDAYVVTWHDGPMPAYQAKTYATLDAAKASISTPTSWQKPDEDADGDIVLAAYIY